LFFVLVLTIFSFHALHTQEDSAAIHPETDLTTNTESTTTDQDNKPSKKAMSISDVVINLELMQKELQEVRQQQEISKNVVPVSIEINPKTVMVEGHRKLSEDEQQ